MLFLLFFAALPAWAQTGLTGYVRDSTGRPIARAEVAIEALSLRTVSDAAGRYVLAPVPAGLRLIRARAIGYQPVAAMLRIVDGASTPHDITLERTPQYLDTVVVKEQAHVAGVGLSAFEERRKMGFGKFFDSTFLRQNEHRKVQDLLAGMSGVRIIHPPMCQTRGCWQPPTTMRVAISSRLGKDCTMQVMLDGVPMSNGSFGEWESAFDLNTIETSSLSAVEVYRSAAELPGEFGGARSQCGVLVLWTKREP